MKISVFLILMLFGVFSFSQKLDSVQQYKILSSIDTMDFETDYRKIIDTCDKYLNYDFSECKYKAGLYGYKALALGRLLDSLSNEEEKFFNSDIEWETIHLFESNTDSLTQQVINLYRSAINSCPTCELNYYKDKYEFEYMHSTVNKDDFKKLKKNGYFGIEDYWSISPQYFYSQQNQWIGLELSANHLQHFFLDEEMVAVKFGVFGFRKNISQTKGWGMNFSLLSGSVYWLNARPLNISYLNNGENNSWGYSPEVGFQVWYLHLNAGYNLAFKKSMRSYEKLYFTAKFDIPIHRF